MIPFETHRLWTRLAALLVGAAVLGLACGPVPPPSGAYNSAPDLLRDLETKRGAVRSFRITGRVDHFGEEHRIQGKTFLFAKLPSLLRVEIVSPFNSPLSVLTVNADRFQLHDLRESRYLAGPAKPCNISRLIRIPLPPEDVMRILIGHTPLISGKEEVSWNDRGFYIVKISDQDKVQRIEIGPSKRMLPLMRSRLKDKDGTVFDIAYNRWSMLGGVAMPHEISIKMPRHKADLLLRYDEGGVELNVDLPDTAWNQTVPKGLTAEEVNCD